MRDLPDNGLVHFVCHDGRYSLPDPNLRMHAVLSKIWEDIGMRIPFEEIPAIYISLHQIEALLFLAFAVFHNIMKLYLLESVFHLTFLSLAVTYIVLRCPPDTARDRDNE